jgi:Spy/CpxP family protein refolding chaperone
MNSNRNVLAGTVLAAAALLSAGALFSVASDADTTTPSTTPYSPPPGGPHGRWHHHGEFGFLKQLNLTDAQKASIKSIMQTNGPQLKSLYGDLRTNSSKLRQTQPDDPNYSNVVSQTASANASVHQQIDTLQANTRQEIFAKLTPEQKTQLKTLQAEAEARHAAHAAHAAGAEPPVT